MSMSSLGRQLAALQQEGSGGGKHAGSTLATSRRHEDAVGRGVAHSVELGHGLAQASHSAKYKPSILYEDARQAADVPLTTVRENAVASLRQLQTEMDPSCGVYVTTLCGKHGFVERGMQTGADNDAIDKCIEDLLYKMSLYLATKESEAKVLSSCLHIFEFLLRQHDLHLRPRIASAALLALLPHHEEPYYLRLLQLIDLANLPEWAFLRPYAVPQARLARTVLAKQASKSMAMVRMLGHLSQKTAALLKSTSSNLDIKGNNGSGSTKCLSFSAAVLVEALTLQMKRAGSMDESTCAALLPFVVTACKSGSANGDGITQKSNQSEASSQPSAKDAWINWGYVLVSTMVEAAPLAARPRKVLVASVLQGLPALQYDENGKPADVSSWYNGLIVALAVLAQGDEGQHHRKDDYDSPYLPILSLSSASSVHMHCGYATLDMDILRALVQLDKTIPAVNHDTESKDRKHSLLAICLGQLLARQGLTDFAHMIASILVVGWRRQLGHFQRPKNDGNGPDDDDPRHSKKNRKKRERERKQLSGLIVSLVEEPLLQGNLWGENDGQWVASYTSFIILHTPVGGDKWKGAYTLEGTEEDTAFAKCVLKALRQVDEWAYEEGLAHGLMHLSSSQTQKSWAHWLGLADNFKAKEQAERGCIIDESRKNTALILPPRVSLEHADCAVRLGAIAGLLKEALEENIVSEGGIGETIAQSLMRRFLTDDNEEVALSAAEGLTKLVVDKRVGGIGSTELGKDAMEAVFLWAENSTLREEQKAKLLEHGLRLVSFAAAHFHSDSDDSLYFCLLECLGTFMSNANEEVALSAARGTILALSKGEAPLQQIDAFDRARVLLVSDEHVLRGFRRDFERPNRSEQHFRRRFVGVLLHSFEAALSIGSGSVSRKDTGGFAIEYCIWVKTAYAGNLTTFEKNALGKCLLLTVDCVTAKTELLHATMCQLAASDDEFFDTSVAPFIAAVCRDMKCDSGKVSPVAVIMEIALSTDDVNETSNLLVVAKDLIATSYTVKEAVYAVVPSLALMCHDSTSIRSLAVDILSLASKAGERNMENLYEFCTMCSSNRSSVLLGGAGFLAETLAVFAESTKATLIQKSIMDATLRFAAAYGSINSTDSDDYFVLSWLGAGLATGGYKAAATLLKVFEAAGDRTFSIHSRWMLVGKPLLDAYHSPRYNKLGSVSESLLQLIRCTVQILKGARFPNPNTEHFFASKTIITTGPASEGGRSRSYSFGKVEGVSFVSPYPKDMQTSLLSVLSTVSDSPLHGFLRGSIFDLLFRSQSWRNEVFSALPIETKHGLALSILSAASEGTVTDADLVFFSLPLNARDVSKMLEGAGDSKTELAKLAFLTDFVRLNREALIAEPSVDAIFSVIFKQLVMLSKESLKRDLNEYEYLRHTILATLHEFFASEKGSNFVQWCSKDNVKSWLDLLVDLLGANENSVLVPLVSIQSIRKAYGILALLSQLYPKEACPKLIPTLASTIASFQSLSGESSSLAECLNVIVPAYLKNRERSGLSVEDLLVSFVRFSITAKNELRYMSYQLFVESLERARLPGSEIGGNLVGAFIGSTLACEIFLITKNGKGKEERGTFSLPELAASMLGKAHSASRLQIIHSLQSYAKDLLFTIIDEESANDANSVIFSSEDLASMVISGPNCVPAADPMESRDNISVEELARTLMVVVCDAISSHDVRRLVKRSKEEDLMIVFRMWQKLLLVQAVCNRRLGRRLPSSLLKASVVERVGEIATQTLDVLQGNIANQNFLAFVTTLISNGETDELRVRAIQLIVDRTEVFQSNTAEGALFLEMVPTLLALIEKVDGTENSKILLQSIFVAIESIGRRVFLSLSDPYSFNPTAIFTNVAQKAAQAIDNEWQSVQGSSFGVTSSASRQLVISTALCSSTAIKISGPSILSAFPLLIRSLLQFLHVANQPFRDSVPGSRQDLSESSHAKMVQLAVLRFLTAAVEKLPQFLKPYIGNLLQRVSQTQESLRSRSDNDSLSVQNELQQLELSLILRVPARQLIHAASKSIIKTESTMSTQWILSVLSESVKASKSTELASQTNNVLNVATHAFEEGVGDTIEYAIELLVLLILKLSEVQLRSLYTRLRDWRGELDGCDPAKSSRRRFAFWKLSSRLSKQLKSIFMPCLSIVFSDAVDELELAVSRLCKKETSTKLGGKKRQKLSGQGGPQLDAVSLQSLQSLLLCLELSLRADAHDGGIWVREAEAQRFHLLLGPLARLLHCRLPLESTSQLSYRHLVRGHKEEGGTVCECIVALALATGDEQMWKPMNHAVLQACSNEDRPEVRNAGIACLLSLITSIGEEYMVLIPECLPVLSELLEDIDEETAGLAQECISQSEELLGESLQDSLR